jgi:hypothetical protein
MIKGLAITPPIAGADQSIGRVVEKERQAPAGERRPVHHHHPECRARTAGLPTPLDEDAAPGSRQRQAAEQSRFGCCSTIRILTCGQSTACLTARTVGHCVSAMASCAAALHRMAFSHYLVQRRKAAS